MNNSHYYNSEAISSCCAELQKHVVLGSSAAARHASAKEEGLKLIAKQLQPAVTSSLQIGAAAVKTHSAASMWGLAGRLGRHKAASAAKQQRPSLQE